MYKLLLTMLVWTTALVLSADVVVRMDIPRPVFIQYEPVIVNLTLRNNSGQVLVFGSAAELRGHMEIELTDMHNRPIQGSGAKIDLHGLMLKAGTDHHIRVNLSKWINLTNPGSYKVKLFISHPMLRNEFESNRCTFEISPGKIFWSRNFGVPQLAEAAQGTNQQIAPIRTYNLRAVQDKSEVYIFLFIEDEKNIYAIKRIGMQMGREMPKCEMDMLNRIHILMPLSSKTFQYQVFDWNGVREENKVYRTTDRVPVLFRDPATGEIKVIGGEAATPGVDYAEDRLLPDMPSTVPATPTPSAGTPAAAPAPAPASAPVPVRGSR